MSYVWWRNKVRLPSVKTLKQVFGDRANEAREVLEGKRKTTEYKSVIDWVNTCYHHPEYTERVLCALNEIAGTFGVEYVEEGSNSKSPAIDYLNAGDTYTTTLCFIEGKGFRVTDIGSLIEKGNYQ